MRAPRTAACRLRAFVAACALFALRAPAWASFINGQAADLVIGQPTFNVNTANNNPGGTSLNSPYGVWVSTRQGQTFVADYNNHRVLIYNTTSPVNGRAADFVLGQPDLFRNTPNPGGVSAWALNGPISVYVYETATSTQLFVADYSNHRILVWNGIPSTNTVAADFVLGQTGFAANSPASDAVGLYNPNSMVVNAGRLYIADYSNHRVKIHNFTAGAPFPTANGPSGDNVLGQSLLGGCVWWGHHYNCSSYANNGHDNAFPNAFWYPFDVFVSTPAGKTLVVDGQNNRVLVYNSTWPAVVASTANAAIVLGQPDFQKNGCNSSGGPTAQTLCQPSAVWVSSDGVKVAVTDEANHRVLIWNSFPTANGQAANVVVGQANMTSQAAGAGSAQLYNPMMAFYDPAADQFFVSDWNNHRVWVKNGFPATDGLSADFVLGQNATIGSAGANRGAGSPDATTLYAPRAAAAGKDSAGNNYLYVSDHYNYRVLAYSLPITQNAQGAFRVLGQPDFVTRTQNNGGTSAASLGSPVQLFFSSGSLYVSDGGNWCTGGQGNNRVLVFTSSVTANQQAANRVIGQPSFTTNGCNQGGVSGSTLYGWWDWPGLGVWASGDAVAVADPTNHRVLFYRPLTGNGQAAAAVLGQPGFGYNDAGNRFISNKVLYAPTSVTTDGQNLFVADYVNHRVLGWRLPITVNQQPADYVLGQASFTFPVGQLAPGVDACNAGGISEQSLCYPAGVFASSGTSGYKLYVGEWSNNRVLVWTSTISAMRQGASFALGQPVTTSNACNNGGSVSPQTLCNVGRQLWADEKALSVPDTSNNRVLRYFPPPAATNAAAGSVLGQPTMTGNTPFSGASPLAMNSYYWSRGVVSDGTRLATVDAGNNRVMIWNSLPGTNGQGADIALGQTSMSNNACNQGGLTSSSLCNPYGLHWDGRQFFVADTSNHRILVWNRWPTTTGQPADFVIGQAGFNTQSCNLGSLQVGLCSPEGLWSDGHRLWVADWSNNRVVAYALPITANQPPAILELGQPASSAWTTNGANQGGITASSLYNPSGVHFDGERLFVADYSNNRVLQWNARPTLNGQGADIVLGQPNASANACNNGGVTAQTMCCPAVPYSDGARLYVSDLCNHRTMVWNSPPTAPQQAADGVLGRSALNVGGCCEQTANSQTYPDGSFLVGNTLWQQDNWYHRVLRYTSTATNLFAVSITSALVPVSVAQTTVPALGFKLFVSAPSSGLTWTRLTLYNNSNLLDNSLQARLYKEAGGNTTLDSGDTAISAQLSLSNGKASLFFSQSLTATQTTYYIALYANSASLPYGPAGFPQGSLRVYHNLHSFGFAQSGVELAGAAPVGLAYNSGFFGPVDAPDYVVFGATTGAAFSANLLNASTGIVVASLTLGTTNDYAFMTSLAVNRLGSAPDSDIAGLALWRDNNADGLLDGGDVNLTSSSSPFAGGVSFVSPSTPLEVSTLTKQYLLVADFAGTAQNTTFGINIDTSSFSLNGLDLLSPSSTAPFSSALSTLRPAVPVVTGQVPTSTWWNSTFTFNGNFGEQGVSYFRYVFDQNAAHVWTNTETQWTSGISTVSAASPAQNWYFHVRAYNSANQGGGALDLGPYWADSVLPAAGSFSRFSPSAGWIGESTFDRLASGVTVQLTVQDSNAGLALNFRTAANRVGLWTLNEGAGLTSADLSANGNTATLSGAGLWSGGYEGMGVTLPGQVDVSTPAGVSWSAGLTVLGWVRPTCGTCGYQTAWASSQFRFQAHAAGGLFRFQADMTNGGGCGLQTPTSWAVNAWHHVALVMDPAGAQNRIYINGQQAASCSGAGAPVNTKFRFGADGVSGIGGTDGYNGSLDQLSIFNASLSQAQIQDELNASRPAFPVVYYSTTAGAGFQTVVSTIAGAGPYLGYTGATGTTASQTLALVNVNLAQSTNAVVCGGGSPCAATNQVKAAVLDSAGNVRNIGPFSVLVDAYTPAAISTPALPSSATWANAAASFQWLGPSTTTLAGMGAGAFYLLEVANNDPAFAPGNIVISVSTPVNSSVGYGSYVSTFTLANLTTYYWRVAARSLQTGNTSPWSQASNFRTDYSSSIASAFARTSSTGGLIGDAAWDTLASGASAQLTVQDLDSGLTLGSGPGDAAGYWSFDEGAGAVTADRGPGANTLSFSGASGWAAGVSGNAALLGGSNRLATSGAPRGLALGGGPRTCAAWLYPTSFPNSSHMFLGYGNSGSSLGVWCGLSGVSQTPAGRPAMGFYVNDRTGGSALPQNQWSHVAATYDGVNIRLYANGALVDQGAPPSGAPNTQNVLPLHVGANPWNAGTSESFVGRLDDVRFYNRALTAGEVAGLQSLSGAVAHVALSTTAGSLWTTIASTAPAGTPYFTLTGSSGSTAAQTISVHNLTLARSTHTGLCAGEPCTATNQLKFVVSDVAGNLSTFGPFALRVDTPVDSATPTLVSPVNGAFTGNPQPLFSWLHPGTTVFAGIDAFHLELSSYSGMSPLLLAISTPAPYGVAAGSYLSTATLDAGATYYWRVRARSFGGAFGPYSSIFSFNTDFAAPAIADFLHFDSTGGAFLDYQFNNLSSGVTVQVTAQDVLTGLRLAGPPDAATAALWQFEEGVGPSARNSANGANPLALTSGAGWGAGKWGRGAQFDGVNDYATTPHAVNLNLSNAMTLGAWLKPSATVGGDTTFVHKGNGNFGYYLGYASGKLVFWAANGTALTCGLNAACVPASLAAGVWQYVTGTYDGVTMRIYLNGALSDSLTYTGGIGTNSDPLILGSHAGTARFFNGVLDDVRIYDYARGAAQVQAEAVGATPPLAMFSNDAGWSWAVTGATYPVSAAAPYLSLTGTDQTVSSQTYQLRNVNLWQSTSTFTGALATNQVRFLLSDIAGNLRVAGPYAVLFDSSSLTIVSTPSLPAQGAYISTTNPTLIWVTPNLGSIVQYAVQVSSLPSFSALTIDITTPAVANMALATHTVAGGLLENVTYYWRVQCRTNLNRVGPWSSSSTFVTDFTPASTSAYAYLNSAAIALNEGQFTDLADAVTAQIRVQDLGSGVTFAGSSPGERAVTSSTLGLWHFNENSGATAADAVGASNGTLNATTWTPGKFGSGLSFGSGSAYMFVSAITLGSNWTIEAWSQFPLNNTGTGWRTLVYGGGQYHVIVDVNGNLGVQNGPFYPSGYNVNNLTGWHRVTAVGSGGSVSFYIDGIWVGTSGNQPTAAINYFGNPGAANQNWGVIDELQVLNVALPASEVQAESPYFVQWSTTAGRAWNVVTSTTPAATPYVGLTGSPGSTASELLTAYNLPLVQSTNTTTCGGSAVPCGASNQVRFGVLDRAGNVRLSGYYAILIDTSSQVALSTPALPTGGAFIGSARPGWVWNTPNTTVLSGITSFYLEAAQNTAFTPIDVSVSTPNLGAIAGAYSSTITLTDGTNYYWRVRSRNSVGNFSPYSGLGAFRVDVSSPVFQSFASINSSGAAIGEAVAGDVTSGAAIQVTLRDTTAGLAGSGNYGVVLTTTGGQNWFDWSTWTYTMTGTGENGVLSLAEFGGKLYAGTYPNGRVLSSADGASWTLAFSFAGDQNVRSLAAFNGKLYAGTHPNGKIYSSVDGASWSPSLTGTTESEIWSLAAFNGRLYAGTQPNSRVYSTSDGSSWTMSLSSTVVGGAGTLFSLASFNGRLYAGTGTGGKILSTADGVNWSLVLSGTGETEIRSLAVFAGRLYAGTAPNGKVFSTADGVTWTTVFNSGNSHVLSLAAGNGKLYAGTYAGGDVYATSDGATWLRVLDPDGGANEIASLAAFGGKIYAGALPTARIARLTPFSSSLTGSAGSTAVETLAVSGLTFAPSANSGQTCGGVYPCTATNQVILSAADRAGNVLSAGPYAVVIDTTASKAEPIPVLASGLGGSAPRPEFAWTVATSSGAGVRSYQLDLASTLDFTTGLIASSVTANRYATFPFDLTNGAGYYWRARAFSVSGGTSPYCPTQSITIDVSSPSGSAFASLDAAGAARSEGVQLDLNGGVTVQLTIQDPASGIQRDGPAPLAPIPGTALLWRFDEAGSSVADSGLLANHGSLTGSVARVTGRFANALRFDGTGGYASVPYNASLALSSVTLQLWVNTYATGPGWIAGQDGGTFDKFGLYLETNGSVTGIFGDFSVGCAGPSVNDGRWHQLAITRDGNGRAVYVDGALCASAPAVAMAPGAMPFYLGRRATGPGPYYQGVLDEVRVVGRALSAAEIARDYAVGAPFSIQWSTSAGASWSLTSSTTPAPTPYLSFSGSQFDTAARTLQARQLSLAASTSAVVCAEAQPCGATNQIRFHFTDRVGNVRSAGPYAVLVDTMMAQPAAAAPANGGFASSTAPVFTWSETNVMPRHEIDLSTDAFATLVFSSNTANGTLPSPETLVHASTYAWRVRAFDAIGLASPYSSTASFTVDVVLPAAGAFLSYSSTGVALGEGEANDLTTGATIQLAVQDLVAGLPAPGDSGPPYSVQWSTTAGSSFQTLTATYPVSGSAPYLLVTGLAGSTAVEQLRVRNLALAASTTTTVCGGAATCTATNQLRFTFRDRAGNVRTTGSYAVLVDTIARQATPVLVSPSSGSFASRSQPLLAWNLPAGVSDATLRSYHVQVALDGAFSTLVFDEPSVLARSFQVPASLLQGSTYYWRARAQSNGGFLSPYSSAAVFVIDAVGPAAVAASFASFNSAGALAAESDAIDLLTGVTAQVRLSDGVSGLGAPAGPKATSQTVAEWPLDEGAGASAADVAGTSTGSVSGPKWTLGRAGAALLVDGDNAAVQAPSSLSLPAAFTFEAWAQPQAPVAGSRGAIMGQGNISNQAYLGLPKGVAGLNDDTFNVWMTDLGSGLTEAVASTVPYVAGRWYHLAATYSPGRLRLYVDGVLVGERAVTSTSGGLPFMVGRHYSAANSFRGVIDHPRVLSKELDAQSIAESYRRGSATPYAAEVSTDSGNSWTRVETTIPWTSTTPYLSLSGAYGTAATQTLQARNLQLARSTSSGVGNLGTNQVRFSVYDVAGSSSLLGPYAIIVDTIGPSAVPLLSEPAAGAFVRQAQPVFRWALSAATNPGDIASFQVQVATGPTMSPLVVDEAGVAAPPLTSPLSLAGGTTYYWRARSRTTTGTLSPFASTSSFRVDLVGPAISGFVSFTSTSLARPEGIAIDLAAGVTAQVTVSDGISGLVRPTAPQPVAQTALYWRLDEGGGTTASDASSAGNNGTLNGGAAWADGRVGAALSLDGVDDYSQGSNADLPGDFTLEAWVKPTGAAQSARGAILGQGSGSSQMYFGLPNPGQGAPYVGGRFNFWLTDGVSGTPAVVASTFAPTSGTWYHVAAVYGSGRMKLYVNGELQQDLAYGRGTTTLPVFVGRSLAAGGDYFAGVVDEVRVVASALSQAQLRRDYLGAAGTPARVEVSTNAGYTWTAVERTYAGAGLPYLEYGWTQGATPAAPLKIVNLSLVQSTSTAAGAQGTNQLRFILRDVAENQALAGPYAVIVDSVAPNATPILQTPADQSLSASSAPVLTWTLPAGIGSILNHDVQVSLDPAFATLAQSSTTASRSFVADGLAQGSTYYWRVRARTTLLGASPFPAPYAVVIDTIAPAMSAFRSFNSTGGALAETQWNTLLSGVTVQATIQQAGPGARGLAVSTGTFFVEVSTDAGRVWRTISSTWAAAAGDPYLTLTGSGGTTAPQVMTAYNLALGLSTSGALGAAGTNLVRFNATSVAGKLGTTTFSVLVDTVAPAMPVFASVTAPAEGQIKAQLAASTDPLSGLHAQAYDIELSSDGFTTLLSSTDWSASSSTIFAGLSHGFVYSLRARVRDALLHVSTFSASYSFNLANKIEATGLVVAPSAGLQGQPVPLLRLQLHNAGGNTPWDSLRLASLGDTDSDVQELLLYADANANGAFDAPGSPSPDVLISPPGIRFSGGLATLAPTSPQTITPSTQTFFVAVRIDGLAVVGNRVGIRINDAGAFQPIFARAAAFPISSGLSRIEPGPAVITFTAADLTPPTIPPGTVNVPLLRLLARTDLYTAEISSFTVRLTTGAEADLSTLKAFKDDGDGNFDPARDTLISGGGGQFQNRVATVTLIGPLALRTVTPSVAAFFIAADVSASAGEGNVASFSIPSSTWVRLASSTNAVAAANFPAQTIQTAFVTQNTLYATMAQLDSGNAIVEQGETYTFARLDLRTSIGNSAVDRLTLTRAGLSFDTDVGELAVWRDQDANGVFGTSLDAFLASATFSGGAATLSFASQAVQVSTASFFLRLKVHPGALDGNTVGFKLANTAAIRTPVSYTVVDPAGFPLSTLTPTVRATVNTVSVAALDVAPGSALQGARDVPLMRLALRVDRNLARVSAVRVDLTGSAADADLSRVKVYEGPSVFSVAASTLVTSGLDALSSGTANAFLLLPLTVTPATSYAYLVADVAATAAVGRTFGLAVSTTASISLNAPNRVDAAGFPITSAQVAIQRFPDTVRAYGTSLAPASAPAGQADLLVQKVVLKTSLVDVDVRQLRVSKAGTLTDGEVADLRLWRDANADGALDIFSDVLVTTQAGRFVGGVATLPLANAKALPGGATYLMLLSLSTAATVGRTTSLSLPADSLVVDAPASADYSNFPHQTSAVTVAKPAVTLNVTGRSTAPASALQGQQNVPMLRLDLAAQAHFVDWNRLVLARLGTVADADVTNLRVYRDSNGDGVLQPTGANADTLVSLPGTQVFSGGAASIPLSTQTIVTSTAVFFVAIDLSATAPAGNTVALQLVSPSGIRLAPPDVTGSAGFPITSSATTISPTAAGVFVDVQDAAPPSLLQGTTRQLLASLSLRTTAYAALWRSLRVAQTGTAQDNDIAALSLWHDANDNFQLEPGTDTLLTSGGDRFVSGSATLQLSNREVITTLSRRYFLSADVNLYASHGRTFGVQISSPAHVEIDGPNFTVTTGFPTALGMTTIAKLRDTLYAEVADAAPSAVNQGYESELLKVRLWAARDRVQVSQWKVGRTGTITDGDVSAVSLYGDNGNGVRDAADLLIASTTLAGGQAILRFAPSLVILTSTATFWVTYKVAAAAPIGRQAGMEVSNPGYFTLDSPDVAGSLTGGGSSSLASISDVNTPVMPTLTLPSRYWPHFNKLEFVWVSTVGVGPLIDAEFAVGTAPRATDVQGWTRLPTSAPKREELPLSASLLSGATYYISMKVRSVAGMTSPIGTSTALLVDYVPPPPPAAAMTPGDSAVLLSWSQPWTPPSGVMGYLVEYRTGVSPLWKNAKTGKPSPATSQLAASAFGPSGALAAAPSAAAPLEAFTLAISSDELVQNTTFVATPPSGTVFIRVRSVSGSGVLSAPTDVTKIQLGPLPKDGLSEVSSYPNPFDSRKGSMKFNYVLSAASDVTIRIFTVFGTKVTELKASAGGPGGQAGSNDFAWNGADSSGRRVAKGMYLAVIEAGGAKVVHKVGVIH